MDKKKKEEDKVIELPKDKQQQNPFEFKPTSPASVLNLFVPKDDPPDEPA